MVEHTRDYFLSRLDYNPATGELIWKPKLPGKKNNSWNSRFSGKVAGCSQKFNEDKFYVTVRLDGKLYLAHRLIWVMYYGEEPPEKIDHKDQNGLNNKIDNLLSSDSILNGRNCQLSKNNTSGVNGVYWHSQISKWHVEGHYTESGVHKKVSLGTYNDLEEAKQARKRWEDSQGNFSPIHGKIRRNNEQYIESRK